MVINHNMSAMFAQRSQGIQDLNQQKSMEKLSSGMRINRAGDDASGLAVSEKMRSQIRGLNQASTNAENGISFIQTTEGYLQETTDIVQRIRELAIQSSNGIYSDEDRMQIQVEVSSLIAEVDRVASAAQFNGMNMLTGRFAEARIGLWSGQHFIIEDGTQQFPVLHHCLAKVYLSLLDYRKRQVQSDTFVCEAHFQAYIQIKA